jgi:23S rRNA pseudouridine955/2504/2580 synthase
MGMEHVLIAGTDDSGRRLDRILRRVFPDMPLSLIHRLLREGRVKVDGVRSDAATRVSPGARIVVPEDRAEPEPGEKKREIHKGSESRFGKMPETADVRAATVSPAGSSPGLNILWEGAGLLIVNKPAGLAVHSPDPRGVGFRGMKGQDIARHGKNPAVSLDALVQAYLRDKLPPSLSFKPGPLHRLDQISSGVVVFSTSLTGARAFSVLMRERRLRKIYLALVDGLIKREEIWEDALFRDRERGKTLVLKEEGEGAKAARTRVFPLAVHPPYSFIALEIETGRTHQIRSQAAFHGHPLAGDRKYGGSLRQAGPFLHAFSLVFPGEGPELEELHGKIISAPLPEPFFMGIREIFGGNPSDMVNRLL